MYCKTRTFLHPGRKFKLAGVNKLCFSWHCPFLTQNKEKICGMDGHQTGMNSILVSKFWNLLKNMKYFWGCTYIYFLWGLRGFARTRNFVCASIYWLLNFVYLIFKRENFSLEFFALSEPVWVCELGTGEKNWFFYRMTPDFDGFWFFAAYWVCGKQKKIWS